jgi:hypothetical protein
MASELPIHFFTLVLNGEPFIRYHLERFKALKCPWHWHIIEGLAELKHDTAWSLQHGATIPPDVARDGRSVDGTAEYLDQIARENPGQITIYRAPGGRMWDGKLEMVNAPLVNLPEECLLWEVDSDELWTTPQLELLRDLFLRHPDRTAAVFFCWYLVAPDLAINRRRRFQELEWRRAWRYRKGMRWLAHEPPKLGQPIPGTNDWADVTLQRPFTPMEMEQAGLVFQHFGYVVEPQLKFKETYYGYKGITAEWRRLRATKDFPVPLKQFFNWPWVDSKAMVDPLSYCGILPLAHLNTEGKWVMEEPTPPWADSAPEDLGINKDRYTTNWKLGYHLLPRVINRFGLKVGAEVGVASGGHSNAILERTDVTRLFGVDSYQHRAGYEDVMNMSQKELDILYDNTRRFMARHGDRYKFIRADSVDGAKQITEPLDFVYIDAEHSYEGAKKDLETWFSKVRDGGIVSGHDYNHPNFPGVAKAIHEFMDKENLRIHVEDEFFWWVEKIAASQRGPLTRVPVGGKGAHSQRGVVYLKWGDMEATLKRSIRSVQKMHPELPIHVQEMPADATMLDKAAMAAVSPFDETLYLDADTVVLDRLDFGFQMAVRHGLACCISDCPWLRRYGIAGDHVEYDTGVVFFTRKAKGVFDSWQTKVRTVPATLRSMGAQNRVVVVPNRDQSSFSLTLDQSSTPPFVLPMNWNFRPRTQRAWWGPIKVWHDRVDPPANLGQISLDQSRPETIIQFLKFN